MDIGELRARISADRNQFKAEIQSTKQDLRDMGKEAKSASGQFDSLNAALSKLGVSSEQIKKIQQQVKNANPRILEEQLKDVREQLRLIGMDARQIDKIEKELKEASREAANVKRSLGGIDDIIGAIGAATGLYALKNVVATTTREATKLSNSLLGLDSVAKSFGQSVEGAREATQSLADDGLAPVSTYATAVRNLLSSGLGLEETNQLIETFKDRAAFGRAETVSFSQAIENLSQAFKTEQSELGDLSGMTENFSQILEVGAAQLGKTVNELTQAERAQAKYLGILQLSQPYLGNATQLTGEFSGRQEALNAKWLEAQQVIGEAYIPVLDEVMERITPLIMSFTELGKENQEVIAGVTAATAAVSALIVVIGGLSVAFRVLQASMGPIGWILMGVSSLAAAVGAYSWAADAASGSALKFASSQEELNQKLRESPLTKSANDIQTLQGDIEVLNDIMERRNELMDEYNKRMNEAQSGRGSIENTHELMEIADGIREIDEQLKDMDFETPEKAAEALEKMKEQVEGAIPALLELKKAEGAEIAAKVEHIDRIEELNERYKELNGLEKLNASQKSELASVVEQLKRAYPGMITYLDEEGKWHIRNADAIDTKIEAEKTFVENSAEGMKIYLNNLKATTTAQISEINKQISKLEELSAAYGKAVEETPETTKIIQKINPAAVAGMQTDSELQAKYDERNRLLMSDNEIDKALASITSGSFDDFKVKPPGSGDGSSAAAAAKSIADQRAKAFALDMDTMRFRAEMQEWSKEQQIKALDELRKKHKAYLIESVQDERSIALEIKHLQDDIAAQKVESDEKARKEQFQNSLDWIEEEKYYQRLSLEEELAAWQRVMNRYAAGTEERKQAEREVFRVEQELNEHRLQMAEELEQKREESIKELKSETVDAIKDMRRAEMDAIADRKESLERKYDEELDLIERNKREALDSYDEQKRAIEDTYRDTVNQMDESNYNRERKELVDEMEKYRLSASKKGQDRYKELQEQLRELDERERRRDLQTERDDKLRNLEDQRSDTEDYYDDLRRMKEEEKRQDILDLEEQQEAVQTFYDEVEAIFADSATEIGFIEKTMQDNRLSQLQTTNQQMLIELQNYVRDYENILKQTSGPSSGDQEFISQMQANAINWNQTTDLAVRARLEKENERLGAQLGATKSKGAWYKDGRRLFHTGGTGDFNFRSPNNLMPDEIAAIIQRTEFVFQPKQLGALLDHQKGGGGVNHNYNAPLVEVKEMVVRDEQDAVIVSREFYNLQQNQIRSKGRR